MSNQFRYLFTYEQFVATLLRNYPEAEAMERAVGGNFERFGVLEHAVLRGLGLGAESLVIDVGCGSGRLAAQLARLPGIRYIGTDVVQSLLDYARKKAGREDFRFQRVESIALPMPEGGADFVCFFSVLTHLLPEESYLYLEAARRALKPGGKAVFSFLEYGTEAGWQSFEANLDWVRDRSIAGQLNVFMHRADLRLWAGKLGMALEAILPGDRATVRVDEAAASAAVPPGSYPFGQSICVLRKLREGETLEDAPPRETGEPTAAERRAARRAAAAPAAGPGRRKARDAAVVPDAAAAGAPETARRKARAEGASARPRQAGAEGAAEKPRKARSEGAAGKPRKARAEGAAGKPRKARAEGASEKPRKAHAEDAPEKPRKARAGGGTDAPRAARTPRKAGAEGGAGKPRKARAEDRPQRARRKAPPAGETGSGGEGA